MDIDKLINCISTLMLLLECTVATPYKRFKDAAQCTLSIQRHQPIMSSPTSMQFPQAQPYDWKQYTVLFSVSSQHFRVPNRYLAPCFSHAPALASIKAGNFTFTAHNIQVSKHFRWLSRSIFRPISALHLDLMVLFPGENGRDCHRETLRTISQDRDAIAQSHR